MHARPINGRSPRLSTVLVAHNLGDWIAVWWGICGAGVGNEVCQQRESIILGDETASYTVLLAIAMHI